MTDYYYRRGERTYTVALDRAGEAFTAEVEGGHVEGCWQELRPGYFQLDLPDKSVRCFVAAEEDSRYLFFDGAVYSLARFDPRAEARARRRGGGSGGPKSTDHLCPLTGKVLKLLAAEGAQVAEGQPLLIVEAMKMEHTIKAAAEGTVTKFNYAPGDSVEAGVRLLEFSPQKSQTEEAESD